MEFWYEIKIRKLAVSDDGRVDFDIIEDDFNDCGTYKEHYHTNDEGEGLWEGHDYMLQIAGTCDFSLKQKTNSGKYKAIRKYFERSSAIV